GAGGDSHLGGETRGKLVIDGPMALRGGGAKLMELAAFYRVELYRFAGGESFMRNRYSQELKPGRGLISFFMVLFVLTVGIGIWTLVSYRVGAVAPGDSQLRVQGDGKPLVGGAALALSQAFEEVARLVEPAVVNINTEAVVRRQQTKRRETPEREDPMED